MSGRTQRGKIEAYLCVSQESSNCGYPMQDVQTGLTKKKKEKEKEEEEKKQDMWAVVPYRISKLSYVTNIMFFLEETILPSKYLGGNMLVLGKCIFGRQSAMSGSRSLAMRKRKVVGPTDEEDMSPQDVEEFRTDIVEAGARLADLVVKPYPDAHLVNNALYAVTEIVECFCRKGRWVTSWASIARKEFLATESVRKVSGCVAFIGMTATLVCSRYFCYRLLCRRSSTVLKNLIYAMRLTRTTGGEYR